MVRIMTEPKNSVLKQYQRLFEIDGVTLSFDDDALKAIADLTVERKTGARGLRSIFEGILNDIMFTVPDDKTITQVRITKEAVTDSKKAVITHKKRPKARKAANFKKTARSAAHHVFEELFSAG